MLRQKLYNLFCLLLVLLAVNNCAPQEKEWTPDKRRKTFAMATRQVPPQPVYSRLRWVNPPEVLPAREKTEPSTAPLLLPVVHLQLKSRPLDQAVMVLAGTARYTSFCPSTLAKRKITINKLGTIEELAQALSEQAAVDIQVLHDERQLLVSKRGEAPAEVGNTPSFYQDSSERRY